MNKNIHDNTKLWLLVATILILGGAFFALFTWSLMKLKWWFLCICVCYIALLTIVDWVATRVPGRITKVIYKIIFTPLSIFYIIVSLIQPFITIVGTYFFVTLYAFGLPALFLLGFSKAGWLGLKPETIIFVAIALGSILCSTFHNVTKWIVHQTPLTDRGEHKYETYREELAVYLIHPNNVIFLMYLIYFIYLGMSGFFQIQNGSYLISEGLDSAILKAFLVFIAFTNMRSKSKDVEVDAKGLLQRTLKLFEHDKY